MKEEKEVTYQKWCAFKDESKTFAVINSSTYGGSAKDNILNILKYPRYLYLITMYYGKYGCEIAETILEKSIINQSNIISNNNNNKSNTFTQMISDNILIPVQHTLINNNINY